MSHFVVICATETGSEPELEDLLAPYDENLEVEEMEDPEYGNYMYNPDAKWDWWTIGGRWDPYFALKNGGESSTAQKSTVDFKSKQSELVATAKKHWMMMDDTFKDLPPIDLWEDILKKHKDAGNTVEQARVEYHAQPRIVAAKERSNELGLWYHNAVEEYQNLTEEQYIKRARMSAYCGYAYLDAERGWVSKGEMGWFGVGSDTIDSELKYYAEFATILNELPDAMFLSAIDCHI